MSETHLAVFDHTIQQTNVWLKTLMVDHVLGEKQHAYSALRAVLHALRDRLPPENAVQLGAQLPILVRGIYYEGWRMGREPHAGRRIEDFLDAIAGELPPQFPRDPLGTASAVFDLLWRELDPGETAKIIGLLPEPLRRLWPLAARP